MRVGALAPVFLLVLALPHAAGAQCPSRFGIPEFVGLVDKYRAGVQAPIELLRDCPSAMEHFRNELEGVRGRLRDGRAAGTAYQGLRGDPRVVRAGAMLLFDVAREALSQRQPAFTLHLETASRLLEVGGDASLPFAGAWYAATARWLRVQFFYTAAERLLASARGWLPSDVKVLYESGVTAELLATAYERRERVHGEIIPRTPMVDRSAPRGDPEKALAQAAGWFRTILARDPLQDLVSVRLAHVLLLQEDTTEVIRLGTDVTARTADPALAYVANMLAGAALEREGDVRGAALHYQLAAARYAPGQSAHIALSEVLQRQGRHDEARAALEAFLQSGAERREPWWAMMLDSEPDINGVLAELRRSVRR